MVNIKEDIMTSLLLLVSVSIVVVTMYSAYVGDKKVLAISGGSCILWFMSLIILL